VDGWHCLLAASASVTAFLSLLPQVAVNDLFALIYAIPLLGALLQLGRLFRAGHAQRKKAQNVRVPLWLDTRLAEIHTLIVVTCVLRVTSVLMAPANVNVIILLAGICYFAEYLDFARVLFDWVESLCIYLSALSVRVCFCLQSVLRVSLTKSRFFLRPTAGQGGFLCYEAAAIRAVP
jgi:hypothetical protein